MDAVLVAGGAGYIGSYMCKLLADKGYLPVVLDDFSMGHRQATRWGVVVEARIADQDALETLFARYPIAAVMHFAAFAYVGESVTRPDKYYENNVAQTIGLLGFLARRCTVPPFIFSSTCATYGEPESIPIAEDHPQRPINPYGRSKRMVEQILDDFSMAHGLRSVVLRYFNAAGADPEGQVGEDHRPETHLIPLVLQTALGRRASVDVYGDDYPTADGTCVRDYIHIHDLAQAHLLALEKLRDGFAGGSYNLGNGNGYSVLDVIETARRVTGKPIAVNRCPRRQGDPAALVGASEKAVAQLGWQQRFNDLEQIIATAWRWHRTHPDGYAD